MLARIFPATLTNEYQGSWLAIWFFTPVLIAKTVIGFNISGLNPFVAVAEILKAVDGAPLDTFSDAAAAAVVDSAGAWGMALFALCLFIWFVLIRYRAGLPLAIGVLLFEQLGRTAGDTLHVVESLIRGAAMPGAGAIINLAMTCLLLMAVVLSVTRARPKAALE